MRKLRPREIKELVLHPHSRWGGGVETGLAIRKLFPKAMNFNMTFKPLVNLPPGVPLQAPALLALVLSIGSQFSLVPDALERARQQ